MRRLLYLTVLSMLVVALTASVALGQSRGPSGADGSFNCPDFDTQAQAQEFFRDAGTGDPDGLDADSDGIACESLPAPTDTVPFPPETTTPPETTMATTTPPETTMAEGTTSAGGAQYEEETTEDTESVTNLPDTGGPSVLLLGGALLMGAGLVSLTALRRRSS